MNLLLLNLNLLISSSDINRTNDNEGVNPYNFLIFIGCFLFIILLMYLHSWRQASRSKNESMVYEDNDIDPKLFILVTCVINSDNNATSVEIEKVKRYISKSFKKKKAERYISYFNQALTKNIDLDKVINEMNYDLSYDTIYDSANNLVSRKHKVKWLHFLVSIAVSDRILSNTELEILTTIRKGWEIHANTLDAILALFNYYTEEDVNRQQTVKQYKTSSLERYYKILELKENASQEEIKKAYRTFAKLYHPDKQIGKKQEKTWAKKRFQEIQEAYDKLNEKLN